MNESLSTKSNLWNNNTFKVVMIAIVISILAAVTLIGVKRLLPSNNDIKAFVSSRVITINDSLFYKDSSVFATDYRWFFGDGSESFSASGFHKYTTPGNYTVQLNINNKYADTFFVTVKDTVHIIPIQDSVIAIDAPDTAMQYETMSIRAKGGTASTQYRWQFGESVYVDAKEAFVQYAYKIPGNYTILLYTDINEYPARHQITILPGFQPHTDSLMSIDDMYKKYEEDFKSHLQAIADGNDFNTNYYYLIHKYLCNNEKAPIKINDTKVNDFNSYCLGLQFDKGVIIQSVKLSADPGMDCMKSVEVKQGKSQ
jgi:hypothetical protein